MAIDRRFFLAGAGAALLAGTTRPAFAAARPRYLSAAATLDGRQVAVALADDGAALYDLDLSDRGHGLALRPGSPEAVCFGRRPGAFALVFDLAAGDVLDRVAEREQLQVTVGEECAPGGFNGGFRGKRRLAISNREMPEQRDRDGDGAARPDSRLRHP